MSDALKEKKSTYSDMILAALSSLKDRKGSSRQAIEKYIKINYMVGDNCGKCLHQSLKRMSDNETIVHSTGTGAHGSFKLNKAAAVEKPKKTVVKKPAAKKPAAKTPAENPTKPPKKAVKPLTKKSRKAVAEKPKKATKKPAAKPKKPTPKKPTPKKAAKSPKKK